MLAKPASALVIVGHGSTVNPDSSTPTHEHAAEIRRRQLFAEVTACFWKEQPSMREVAWMLESDDVYVVPNFISEGYFTQTVIPRELGLTGPLTRRGSKIWKLCQPVGSHSSVTDLLLLRAAEAAPGIPQEETSLLIVGHGTSLNDNSAVAAKEQAAKIRNLTRYAAVLNTYMEEPPLVSDWVALTNTPNVVVVPFFISDGLHSYEDIPVLLGIATESQGAASTQQVFRRNPYRLQDRNLYYASAIGTEPGFAEIILSQVAEFDKVCPS